MNNYRRLSPEELYPRCDSALFPFETTAEVEGPVGVVGQPRAVAALEFGLGIKSKGYNLFVYGPPASGKRSIAMRFLQEQSVNEPVPSDWCYVNNFKEPQKPRALCLPAGFARKLETDMVRLIDELKTAVPLVFEGDQYRVRRQEIEDQLRSRQEQAFTELKEESLKHNVEMIQTSSGFAFVPKKGDEVIKPEEFNKLSVKEKEHVQQIVAVLKERLEAIIQQIPKWQREAQQQTKQLNRDMLMQAVAHLIDELRADYQDYEEVLIYLDEVQQDIVENGDQFRRGEEGESGMAFSFLAQSDIDFWLRYSVNVMCSHEQGKGAPVIYLEHPTFANLIGRIEHRAQLGALVTDFNLIKPGALHQANGGYLLIDARELLMQPFGWEGIKRCLRFERVEIEALGQSLGLISTVSLEPEAIPLSVKIILLGERQLYYLLSEHDPEFAELFKVAVDFSASMPRNNEQVQHYAEMMAATVRNEGLRHLDRNAVARIIEESARYIEDNQKLSAQFGHIADLMREADYWAGKRNAKIVGSEDVAQSVSARRHRHAHINDLLVEEIERRILLIDTRGDAIGQANGLSVIEFGEHAWGHPSRITARVHIGKGEVVDIEREIELGGPIHSKGVLILGGYIGGRYAPGYPLSLSASLVFEQTYGGVEGDSASLAELCALLSALGEVPLKQAIGITGSINQHGQIQAVGAINEKIEGFFDACKVSGLTGEQGVLIPEGNVQHLMLRDDLVDAVNQNQFHIYAATHVDQAMDLLTGMQPGERDDEGAFAQNSINERIEARLIAMAEHGQSEDSDKQGSADEKEKTSSTAIDEK